jgi:GT2 family glycosyltransferase
VLIQEVDGLEVVVCDDGSRDETPAFLGGLEDPRVRRLSRARPGGVAAARNACLAVARGEFITWLDSDDLYEPGALAELAAVLEADATIGMVHAAHHVIDAHGAPLPDWPQVFKTDRVEEGHEAFAELVLENYVAAPTVMVRRSAHERVGPYDEVLEQGEDWEMWLRLTLDAGIAYRAEPLARYRYHSRSLSGSSRRSLAAVHADTRVIERLFAHHGDRMPARERHRRRAELALAARALNAVGESYTRGDDANAMRAARFSGERAATLDRSSLAALIASIERRDDYGVHETARLLLRSLAVELEGSRFAARLRARIEPDPAWCRTLGEIATIVRRIVPAEAQMAVVDKWDPTLRQLSGRTGRTFPDRRQLPDGYPRESATARGHLEAMRAEGVQYLVFTVATRWWLDHYEEFARYLARSYRLAWEDPRCVIYDLR